MSATPLHTPLPKPLPKIDHPFFLVGSERSGTTLLRLMLDHHPRVAFGAEFDYATALVSEQGNYPNLPNYYQWLSANRNFSASGSRIDPRLTYPELVNSFLRQLQRTTKPLNSIPNSTADEPIIGATVHQHFDRLLYIWPNAKFIHIVRDGRDVTRSCIKMGWAGDGWHGSARWLKAERLWDRLKSRLPADRRLEVRFEALVENTTATLDMICQFMGEQYHPAMMDYVQGTDYSLPDARLLNHWHSQPSKREIQLIEARIAPMLVERKYPLSGLPAIRVSKASRLALRVQNKLGILHRRARRYGLPLVSADVIARRLRLYWLSARVNKALNMADLKSMKQPL